MNNQKKLKNLIQMKNRRPNFPPNRESLVSQEIINNLNQDLQLYSQNQEKKEELEEKINLANAIA